MKRLKYHWSAQPLSYLLSVLMGLPAFLMLLVGAPAAHAQGITHNAQAPWAVIDFVNRSGYGGNEIGRAASDALVVELGKSNKYEISPRQEVDKAVNTLGQTLPLDTIGMQKLGRELGVQGVATGEVASVSFSSNPRQATATIVVRVVNPISGELINGALAQGTSTPRAIPTNDDDALVNQAIDNAAYAAVRQISAFNLPVATVLNNRDEASLLLNKGTRDGMYDGLDMVVTRNGFETGRIRVSTASSDQSDAVVTRQEGGIRPEDRATAIYVLPSYTIMKNGEVHTSAKISSDGGRTGSNKKSMFSGVTGIVVALLVGALLLNLARRGSSSGALGGGEIGGPTALFGRVNDQYGTGLAGLVGVQGIAPSNGALGPAQNYVPVAVRIRATKGNIPAFNFNEYHVYRLDFDPPTIGTSTTDLSTFGQVPIISVDSQGNLDTSDDGLDRIINSNKPSTGAGSTTTTTGTQNVSSGVLSVAGSGIPLSLVGARYQYFIEGLWNDQATQFPVSTSGGTTTSTTGQFHLTSRKGTNFITYLQPPLFTSNSITGTGPTNVNVSFPSTRGADTYVLEISTSPSFSSKKTYGLAPGSIAQPYAAPQTDPRRGNTMSFLVNKDLRPDFPGATQLFARAGARDSRNGTSNLNPYIYSDYTAVPSNLLQ